MVKKQVDLPKIYEESLRDLKEGEIIKGKIVEITKKDVFVDVGYKSEGIIPLAEFPESPRLKIGDEVEVLVESKENENGMVVLSSSKARFLRGWQRVISSFQEGDLISGRVLRQVKGGFMVDLDEVEGFLPNSISAFKGVPSKFLNQEFKFKIVKINKPRRNIVLSRRDALILEKQQARAKILENLKEGQLVEGTVKNITDFGAFIDLGGVDGLLHINDMSWSRISHPSEMLALGEKIEVLILSVDRQTGRVSLGLKQKTPNPWANVQVKYPVGSKVKGKVVNILPFGAFIELEKGLEGLLHISELSWTKKLKHPSEVLAIGDVVEAVVLNVDAKNKKLSLGMRQMEADPWQNVESKYPLGSRVRGKVSGLVEFGAFIELEKGLEGLLHISDISWTKHINHPQEVLKRGQIVDCIILSVDRNHKRISLGIRQLFPDPWGKIAQKYPEGKIMEGKVTKVLNFGIFVELEEELEGLIKSSELEGNYVLGDLIKVKILKVDTKERKIFLTAKGVDNELKEGT